MPSVKSSLRNNAWQAGNGATTKAGRFEKQVAFMLWNTIFMFLRIRLVFVPPMYLCKVNTHIHKPKKTPPKSNQLQFWLFPQIMSLPLTYVNLVKGGITCKNICIVYANIFSLPTTFLLLAYYIFMYKHVKSILNCRD